MSQNRTDKITSVEQVLPLLQTLFYDVLKHHLPEGAKMYLVGSRGRTPFDEWNKIEYKDWDILLVTKAKIRDIRQLPQLADYHIDIRADKVGVINKLRANNYGGEGKGIEIFPNTPEFLKEYLITEELPQQDNIEDGRENN